ncbi:hypothetical protein FACS1894127_6860 [Clostridia bacterium]|nr:hypothetical protein FACS1894127_6860 [Clostridia bacterium]
MVTTTKEKKTSLLLHTCCGPCSTSVLERLSGEFCSITLYFYNPNITDRLEYERRKEAQISFIRQYFETPSASAGETSVMNPEYRDTGTFAAKKVSVDFIEGPYEPEVFYGAVVGFEQEAEGGSRCEICYRLRLAKTAEFGAKGGYEQFATTLSVSPHKNFNVIKRIGLELGQDFGVDFLEEDFKKKGGFQRSIELSKNYGLYRQNYCGCFFSAAGRK